MSYDDISNTITATTGDQGGRSWQPSGEGKSGHKIFAKRIFTIFSTNASFFANDFQNVRKSLKS